MQTLGNRKGEDQSGSANPFRVFRNRRYGLYFGGQLISQVGTWMQMIAISWLTYKLTNSPLLLATVAVSSQLPSLLLMPFAGVAADRFNRHRLVLLAQVLAMVEASLLAYFTLTGQIQVWHLISLGLFMGVINAIDLPVRSAFVVDLVDDKKDLPATIAMNATLMNISRLLGPAIAGFVVAALGEGMCFLINAGSYVAVIAALLMIKGNFSPRETSERQSVMAQLKDGLSYTMNSSPIRSIITLMALFGLGAMAYSVLMPVYVKELRGDANMLGYLMAASAFGSLVGTLVLASRKGILGLGTWIAVSSILFSLCLIAFSFVHSFWLAMAVLAVMGAMLMVNFAACSTILQAVVHDEKRGRVMSLFTMSFMGSTPIGSLIAGAVADRVGFSTTVLLCGVYCLIVAGLFAAYLPKLRREARPIYIERGLLQAEEEVDLLSA